MHQQITTAPQSTTLPPCARDPYRAPLPDAYPTGPEACGPARDADDYYLSEPWPAPAAETGFPMPTASGSTSLTSPDRHRVDLHSALTAAGIPPLTGDSGAIRVLAELDDRTVEAVIRWVDSASGLLAGARR